MRTIVYVDGFNLYYGSLKGTACRWLDLMALCTSLLDDTEIVGLKYFTAKVRSRAGNPQQAQRPQVYLRALATIRSAASTTATSSLVRPCASS